MIGIQVSKILDPDPHPWLSFANEHHRLRFSWDIDDLINDCNAVLRSRNYLFSAPAPTLFIISAPAPAPAPVTAIYCHIKLFYCMEVVLY